MPSLGRRFGAFALPSVFLACSLALLTPFRGEPAGAGPETPVLEKQVLPILRAKCLECHGEKKQRADLDLRTKAGLLRGGESGPALKPGSLKDSALWEKIASDKMPPGKDKLSAAEKEVVRRWIESGAHAEEKNVAKADAIDRQVTDADRNFWAFRKPVRPPVPRPKAGGRVRNPIDAFIVDALEKKGLTYSPEADRLTLLRRATFDLTGLPPTPAEIEAFLADKAPDAYEKVIDRLLASPRYGERWGRHWLDLAGYADSEGILDADYVRTAAWRYRDYVIRAFNSDKPYDRFLQEQIAGDELVDYWAVYEKQKELSSDVVESVVATGYLRCASDTSRPDFVTIKNAPGYYFQTLDDTVKIVSSSTMGLTVQCARCHSHKYDPIPQTDYYRMQAVFMSGYRPSQWVPQVQRKLHESTAAQEKEAKEHNGKIDAVVSALKKQQLELQQSFGEKLFEARLAKLPADVLDNVRAALVAVPAKRTEAQKALAAKYQPELRPAGPALDKALSESFADYKSKAQELNLKIQGQDKLKKTFPEIRAFYDLPGEPKTHLLRRGDYLTPGPVVQPGTLGVLVAGKPFQWEPPAKPAKTSGRRLAFARWLTQPDHPLTARVMVNRLWLHHFGQGIVATPDNFGRTGSPPSHPELLDWLATELVRLEAGDRRPEAGGWRLEAGGRRLEAGGRGAFPASGLQSPASSLRPPASSLQPPASGWSLKKMHRLMMTSTAYRQASRLDPTAHAAAKKADPDNKLLWRQRLRRLEAEALRDAVLSVAGNLNAEMFGPPVPMVRQGDGQVVVPTDASGARRSVYLQVRRSQPLTFLQLFDQPVIETNCTHRETSTVASQALTVLNSDFMVKQADLFAARALKDSPASPASHAVLLAFGRKAIEPELVKLNAFVDGQAVHHAKAGVAPAAEARRRAVADLCHMLLSANEFAYVD